MPSFIVSAVCTVFTTFLMACSTQPKIVEFRTGSDPQIELDRVGSQISIAKSRQVDVLSPKNFLAAERAQNDAIGLRVSNRPQSAVLHEIAVSEAYLKKANSVAEVTGKILEKIVEARRDAITSNAGKYFPVEMMKADNVFKKIANRIEGNGALSSEKQRDALELSYRSIELDSIKREKLGPSKAAMEEAIREGAKKLTPETLLLTQKIFAESDAAIALNRGNTAELNRISNETAMAAERLLKMVRDAKVFAAKNPEELAKVVESNENAADQAEDSLYQAEADLAQNRNRLAEESARNNKLESKLWLEREYERTRSLFTQDEAKIYRLEGKLLLRLNGLSFASNKSVIDSDKYQLLNKVQVVLGRFEPSSVMIEGHTDALGNRTANMKLSIARARSVQSYLIANGYGVHNLISVTGYGDSRPVATNKTPKGRAQNRRIDVLIQVPPAILADKK
jgi:OOP family OmpA-OmpF porin